MGWFKTCSSELIEVLAILDAIAPNWRFANDDHLARRSRLITTHLGLLERGYDSDEEIWVIIPNELEAFNIKAVLPFQEFGYAVWDDDRKVRNSYYYSGNGNITVPGYVIE